MLKQLLIGFLCLSASALANTQTEHNEISVNESLTRIHIAGDAISPNLLVENGGTTASAHVRIELIDPLDVVRTSADAEVQLKPGANHFGSEGLETEIRRVERFNLVSIALQGHRCRDWLSSVGGHPGAFD